MKCIETNINNFDCWKTSKVPVAISVTSGGLDSISMALAMLKRGYDTIFCHINLGQKSQTPEKDAVKKIVEELEKKYALDTKAYYFIVDAPWVGELGGSCLTSTDLKVPKGMNSIQESFKIGGNLEKPGLWTPGRNIVLLSVAASLADRIHAKVITLGANQSETAYRDNTMDFLKSFELMSRFGTLVMPKFDAPLYNFDKAEILKWGVEHGFYEIYKHTWSCDEAYEHMCGECGCCNNRQLAFLILNEIMGVDNFPDNQTYRNPHYFKETFLPEAIQRFISGMWYGQYLDDLRKLV